MTAAHYPHPCAPGCPCGRPWERPRMFLALMLVFALVSPAAAQDAPEPRAYTLDGVEGLWLPPELAREATEAREELPRLRERFRLLEEDLTLAERQIATLREALALTEEGRNVLREAVADARRAREEAGAWYRDPALWLAVGLVLGAAAVVAAFAAAGG